MWLLVIVVTCLVLLVVVRPRTDRFYGIFRYRNGLQSPGNDLLGQPRGVQEEDSVQPWKLVDRSARPDAAGSTPRPSVDDRR